MKNQWMICLMVTGLLSDLECNTEFVNTKIRDFYFYDQGEAKLEDMCGWYFRIRTHQHPVPSMLTVELSRKSSEAKWIYSIGSRSQDTRDTWISITNVSFQCIQTQHDTCGKSPECDGPCWGLIQEIASIERKTVSSRFERNVCNANSVFRRKWLEIYECLENNLESYSSCHDESVMPKEYVDTIRGSFNSARCCYFSWYHDCFANITQDYCGKNDRNFITFGFLKHVAKMSVTACDSSDSACSRSSLPSNEDRRATNSTVILFYFILLMNLLMY